MHKSIGIDEDIHDNQLTILIISNWELEFPIVHVDASNFALGVMFAQNPNNIINHPINYASRLMTRIEKII
jgi:hypothetical protein